VRLNFELILIFHPNLVEIPDKMHGLITFKKFLCPIWQILYHFTSPKSR